MPDFSVRTHAAEMMDDFSIVDERLTTALDNLRHVNRYLGGYASTLAVLAPYLRRQQGRTVRLLDLATGVADYPVALVRWAARHRVDLEVVGIDVNPATVAYARRVLDRDLQPHLRARIRVEEGDALHTPYDDGDFDVCMAAHFLHHLRHEEAAAFLREMARVARHGILINDLHRHPLAYYGIVALATALPVSPMFRHDGPVSVLRGFTRNELHVLAEASQLSTVAVRWHWAFRWTLSNFEK